jgi:gamma-glutamylputrescine oxidase
MFIQNWWFTTLLENQYKYCPPLQDNIECDVLVIGGGMSGISAAAALLNKGLRVVVLEKNIIGGSTSGRSAGFMTPDSELELSQLVRRYGIEGAKEIWNIPTHGISLVKNYINEFGIDCDYRIQDSLLLGIGKGGYSVVKEEEEGRKEVGFTNQIVYDESELQKILNCSGFAGGIRYDNTFGFNPLQYLQGMKSVLIDNGMKVYESTEVNKIDGNTVRTDAGTVKAKEIIVAIDKMDTAISSLSKQIYHAQTFLSVSEPLSERQITELYPSGDDFQMWDNTLVYSYWRLIKGNRILLGGGSKATTFTPFMWNHANVISNVHSKFKRHFPALRNLNFIQYWPGMIDTSRDLLPIVVRDQTHSHIHYIQGIVGLPWASFCGDFVVRSIFNEAKGEDLKYYEYLSNNRPFALPMWLSKIITKPVLFALNNAWAKYYQKDGTNAIKPKSGEF